MNTLRTWWARLVGVFRKEDQEASMREEMRVHLDLLAEELQNQGLGPEAARREALRQFGHMEGLKESCREQSRLVWLEQLGRDGLMALRTLCRLKGYSVSLLLILMLGIAAVAVVADLARQVTHPLQPFPLEARVLVLGNAFKEGGELALYRTQYEQLREEGGCLDAVASHTQSMMNLVIDGLPHPMSVIQVSPRFFELCTVRPALGRLFTREEAESGDESVVLINHSTWTKLYHGDPGVLGRQVEIGRRLRVIVGVLPESFRNPSDRAGWDAVLPMREGGSGQAQSWDMFWALGRIRQGVSEDQVRARLALVTLPKEFPAELASRMRLTGSPVIDRYRMDVGLVIWSMLGAALFLHAIACLNSMTLILVRMRGRRRELGIRQALGGSHARVRRLLLMENGFVCLAALVLGGLLAFKASSTFAEFVNYWWMGPVRLQPEPLLWSVLAIGVPTVLIVAVAPCLRAFSVDPAEAMKEGGGAVGQTCRGRRWLDGAVVLQAALAVALLGGAGLMLRSLQQLRAQSLGFDTTRKIAVHGTLPQSVYTDAGVEQDSEKFMASYLGRLEALRDSFARLPGVKSAVISDAAPLANWAHASGNVKSDEGGSAGNCLLDGVSTDFLRIMRVPLVRGRGLEGLVRGGEKGVLINESCARAVFAGKDPVGQLLDVGDTQFWGPFQQQPPGRVRWQVLGVVADVRAFGQRRPPLPQIFYPYWQRALWDVANLGLVVETFGEVDASFEEQLRRIAHGLMPAMTLNTLRLDSEKEWRLANERYAFTLLQILAGLALVLTLAGVYSVMAYSMQQRRREFGLRMALGASPGGLMAALLWRGAILGLCGVLLGLGLAAVLGRFLESLLFQVGPYDPVVFGGVGGLLFLMILAASWVPARRALELDPMQVLRED